MRSHDLQVATRWRIDISQVFRMSLHFLHLNVDGIMPRSGGGA